MRFMQVLSIITVMDPYVNFYLKKFVVLNQIV